MDPITKQPAEGWQNGQEPVGIDSPLQMPMQPVPSSVSPPYTVVTSQPTTVIQMMQGNFQFPRGVPRDWSTPLCGCCEDCGGCICAFFCWPCYQCHVASKMGESCCAPCCLRDPTLVMRAHFRGRHNIYGSLIGDACTTCWCTQCALCQVSREIDNIKAGRAAP